jgi:hypothetical protein
MLKMFHSMVVCSQIFVGCGSSTDSAQPEKKQSSYTLSSKTLVPVTDLPECLEKLEKIYEGTMSSSEMTECWRKTFVPLDDADLPFAVENIASSGINNFYVAPKYKVAALHMGYPCFIASYEFFDSPHAIEGCGRALFIGGNPEAIRCKNESIPMATCVDRVPPSEAFDIGLFESPLSSSYIETNTSSPGLGDLVYIVGHPGVVYHHIPEYVGRPLVSVGKVVDLEGRGLVIDALAHSGNSGGPILDEQGNALGIVYTGVRMIQANGVEVKKSLGRWDTVGVRFTEDIKVAFQMAKKL